MDTAAFGLLNAETIAIHQQQLTICIAHHITVQGSGLKLVAQGPLSGPRLNVSNNFALKVFILHKNP